jgi:hypothetical protein
MSGNEWDGTPPTGESGPGREPQAEGGESAAERQSPTAMGQPAPGSEPWFANRAPVEAHPAWFQPVLPANRHRRGRIVVAACAAAAVIIGVVVAAVVAPKSAAPQAGSAPKSNSTHASTAPKSSSPPASSGHAGSQLTAAQVVLQASRQSRRLRSVSATLTEHVSGAASAIITGKMSEQRNPLLLSMSIDENVGGSNIPISAVITSDAFYMKFKAGSLGMPKALAHKWIKIPFSVLGSGSIFGTLMHSVQNDNPIAQTQLLVAAEHLRAVGTQTVGGVSTTKYTGSFTPSIAVKELTPSLRTALAPALKLITGNVDVSIWIDQQHHVRKLTEVERVAANTVTVVCTFSGFNQPVHITVPPASQVLTPPASALSGGVTTG